MRATYLAPCALACLLACLLRSARIDQPESSAHACSIVVIKAIGSGGSKLAISGSLRPLHAPEVRWTQKRSGLLPFVV